MHTHVSTTIICNDVQAATNCNTLRRIATHSKKRLQHTEKYYWSTLQRTEHVAHHCNALQHAAPHCRTLQHDAMHCNAMQLTATHCNVRQQRRLYRMPTFGTSPHECYSCNTLHHTAPRCNTLQHAGIHCDNPQHTATATAIIDAYFVDELTRMLQHAETRCNTLQHAATRCNTRQHAATCCNARQHAATSTAISDAYFVDELTRMLQRAATRCNTLQHCAIHCSTLQQQRLYWMPLSRTRSREYCKTMQHTATHCKLLQLTATHGNEPKDTATAAAISDAYFVCEREVGGWGRVPFSRI